MTQVHEPIAIGGRRRAQKDATNGGEDRCIGADSEAKGEHDREREAFGTRQRTEDVPKVKRHQNTREERRRQL